MTQAQLELPQISFARYLDLLKRRRWQVIPVSLLGLMIGGLVAFFIPRYFVAETLLEYHRPPGDLSVKASAEDPFGAVVENARYTLPLAAGAAMKKLGWDEAAETELFQLRENEKAVEQRVTVVDRTPPRNPDYAQLVVSFRDRDGRRAADFLNAMLQIWVDQRLGELQRNAEAQKREANNRVTAAYSEWEQINRNLEELVRKYGFERALGTQQQSQLQEQLQQQYQREREKRRDELVVALATLASEITAAQQELDRTPQTVVPSEVELAKRFPPGSDEAKLYFLYKAAKNSLDTVVGPAHPLRPAYEKQVANFEKLLGTLGVSGSELQNPHIGELQRVIADRQKAQTAAQTELEILERRLADDKRLLDERIVATTQFLGLQRDQQLAETKQVEANASLAAALHVLGDLGIEPPIKFRLAGVPTRATEPNFLIVAGLGCILGLAIAIGLILLVDVLQGTFKTVDDVERGLPIPVLGGLSHLETEAQRRRVSIGRRRASLIAATFLGSAVVVVTVYYVAPERLPPLALDLLSLVLGK